jgi:hypothetical protein
MNPLQEQLFDIQIDELLIMACSIRKAWLQSASLYLQRAEAHDMLARGSETLHSGKTTIRHPIVVASLPLTPFHIAST